MVNTTQNTAQGAARTSVIRDAHDIVRGNLSRGIGDPYCGHPTRVPPLCRLLKIDIQETTDRHHTFSRKQFSRHGYKMALKSEKPLVSVHKSVMIFDGSNGSAYAPLPAHTCCNPDYFDLDRQ